MIYQGKRRNSNLLSDCSANNKFYFDKQAADDAVAFIEKFMKHTKGKWAGKPLLLEDWQKEIVRDVWGWKRTADGTRKYRTVYIEVPRKNGKSTLAAAFALLLTFADKEQGAEVYSAAADTSQASIVFSTAKDMLNSSEQLVKRAKIYRSSIYNESLNARYEVISADANTKHGLNASGVVIDELHAQKNRELYDVLTTSVGARTQPLVIMLTTAGHSRTSICYEIHEYALKIKEGSMQNDEFYPVIYAADSKDDFEDEATWFKANPNLGVTISIEYFRQEVKKAKQLPSYENTFKRLHLNIWTEQDSRWLPMDKWQHCGDEKIDISSLEGKVCYAGLDLSATQDISAFVLVFPLEDGKYFSLPYFWIPEVGAEKKERSDAVPYLTWKRQGFINLCSGAVVDYDKIREKINELGERFNIKQIAFDGWQAVQISNQLASDGFDMVQMRQGFASMTEVSHFFEGLVISNKLRHNNNPILTWMASNVAAERGDGDSLKPSKKKSTQRIDGIVSLIMGLALNTQQTMEEEASVYEDRGLIIL